MHEPAVDLTHVHENEGYGEFKDKNFPRLRLSLEGIAEAIALDTKLCPLDIEEFLADVRDRSKLGKEG